MARLTPPKSPVVCDKHHSGCMWSLYSLFDFRQGNSSRKLISDTKRLKRETSDDVNVKLHHLLTNFDGKFEGINERNDKRVVPDMPNEKKLKREETSTPELKSMHSASKFVGESPPKIRGKEKKMSQRLYAKKLKQPSHPNPVEKSLDKVESAATSRKSVHHKSRRGFGCKSVDVVKHGELNEANDRLTKQMKEVAEEIVNQKLIEGKYLSRDGVNQESKQLLEGLKVLNSNKELFSKLLEDPNSLLVKHIQDLKDSQVQNQQTKSKARQCEEPVTSDKNHSEGRSKLSSSETIIVLKPDSTSMKISHCSSSQSYDSFGENVRGDRPANLSFGHIKKKLRHVMGIDKKEQHLMSVDDTRHGSCAKLQGDDGNKGKSVELTRKNSEKIIHVDNREMDKSSFGIQRRDRNGEASIELEAASSSGSNHKNLLDSSHPRRSESRIYLEDWKSFSEMLKNETEDNKFFQKQALKTLQRMISYPEYDFLPISSPRRESKYGFVSTQMRFSPYGNSQMAYGNNWRLQEEQKSSSSSSLMKNIEGSTKSQKPNNKLQVVDTKTCISDNHFAPTRGETSVEAMPFEQDGINKNDAMETSGTRSTEEANSSEVLSESDSRVSTSTIESNDIICQEVTCSLQAATEPCYTDKTCTNFLDGTTNIDEENENLKCSRLDLPLEDHPSTPPNNQRVEYPDIIKDRGFQSPVSVLESFFTDATSPPSTTPEHAKQGEQHSIAALVKPPSDPETNIATSLYVNGSISDFIKAVMQASSLNWDELSLKCYPLDQLIDPSLLDTIKLQGNQFCDDYKLIFDCVSEVTVEVYDTHVRHSPWFSFVKPNLQTLPMEKLVFREAMKCIEWHFQPQPSLRTLDQLVKKDLARSEIWLDIRADVEDTVNEMMEGVLDELVMETIFELH
ncbi:hypothetical protein UlMin_001803 [Ulmus minor]